MCVFQRTRFLEKFLRCRLRFVRPTIFLGVPRVYEKMQARMMAVASTITGDLTVDGYNACNPTQIKSTEIAFGLPHSEMIQPSFNRREEILGHLGQGKRIGVLQESAGKHDICNCQMLGMQIEICHICCKLVSCKLGMEGWWLRFQTLLSHHCCAELRHRACESAENFAMGSQWVPGSGQAGSVKSQRCTWP